jgi:3-oxoacyl-[acyl-carrier-protein] synthase II
MQGCAKPILITGAGLITPLGLSRAQTWEAVRDGRCGMGPMAAMESPLPAWADGGQAPDLPGDFAPKLPRESRYLRYTVLQAMRDAGIERQLPCEPHRAGLVFGTTLHGMRAGGEFFRRNDPTALRGFLAGAVVRNACGDLPFRGAAMTTCSACSSSLGAIAIAVTLLRSGELDLVLAGGYDTISEYVWGGFNSLRLVAPGPPRPFTRDRQGMKLAEGYGIVVLQRASDAHARGARAIATVLGFGESADAHHLTQPHPAGDGAARAMEQALASADLMPADIDLVAAHATGTPDNDAAEFAALSRVFGDELARVPVVAFKSHLGHTLGGAGAVELILAATAMEEQTIPACANVEAADVEFAGLNLATGTSKPATIRATLSMSLGFGGANTCVILGPAPPWEGEAPAEPGSPPIAKPQAAPPAGRRKDIAPPSVPGADSGPPTRLGRSLAFPNLDVFITGIGVILPGAVGNDAFIERLASGADALGGEIPDADFVFLLNARRVRRMSQYVKLSLAATVLCLRDAGIADVPAFAQNCAAVLGTMHGSTNYCEQYYGQIVREGVASANPMLFAEGVPNAAAAHLSLMLSLKGPCQTIIGTLTAGLDAMRVAAARIATGDWDRAIVGAAEEFSPTVNDAHARCASSIAPGAVIGSGAIMFLLESRDSMESRGGRPRGRVTPETGTVPIVSAVPVVSARHHGIAECYSVGALAVLAGALLGATPA